MLAVLEPQLEKNRTASRKVACSRAPRGTQYDVHSMHTAKHDAITSSQRSIHTQQGDASRKISALVKRMGVQVS
jgi:hypothetical protein